MRALRHVYWIGGGSGAGKTTVARRLADQHGLQLYETDSVMREHARRTPPSAAPHLARFNAMDLDDRWVNRAPADMLETFHWFRGEGFVHVVDDLLRTAADPPVIAEGFRLLPELVRPLLDDLGQAVWLLPTPRFRRQVFDARGGTAWSLVARTSDPDRALRNLLERDALFTARLAPQVSSLGLTGLQVDVGIGETALADRVAAVFGFHG